MANVQVTVPDSLLAALTKAPHEMAAEIRLAAAIHRYQQSVLSMERTAEAAGLTRGNFLAELARRRLVPARQRFIAGHHATARTRSARRRGQGRSRS